MLICNDFNKRKILLGSNLIELSQMILNLIFIVIIHHIRFAASLLDSDDKTGKWCLFKSDTSLIKRTNTGIEAGDNQVAGVTLLDNLNLESE